MTIWPFRRRGARKRPRSGAALSDGDCPAAAPTRTDGALARAVSKKKQRTEHAKLQRRPRAYSFSPGRRDSIRVDQPRVAHRDGDATDDGADDWQRMPTLHHRNSQHPARRKSSKRRRDDHEREAEIKAMSALTSARAAGTLTRWSSKRAKTASGAGQWEKPPSNVSLPLFDSIHSSQSSDSDCVSFKVSTLSSLAPRPTLRCASGSRWTPSRASAPTRSGSQKKSLVERDVIPEEVLDSRKRIDDLADGLDATDLRELMERDNRRRERKRQYDQDRMGRRLARKAESQRREEVEARQSGMQSPRNLERGVLGRELVGLGIEPPSAVVTSSKKRDSPTSDRMSGIEEDQPRGPRELFHPTSPHSQNESLAADESAAVQRVSPTPPTEADEPVSALPHGSILAGLLRSKKSQSKSTLSSDKDKTTVDDEAPRNDPECSHKSSRLSFVSFLRRGVRNRRNSGPSSFSNTSREEMQAAATAQADALARLQGDDATPQANYLASKPGAGGPKRTRSRFREDLPDYPLSPPDSLVQSPEGEPPLPVVDEVKTPATESRPTTAPGDPPTSGFHSLDALRHMPTSAERLYSAISPDPQLSMSLASIDSEGSWLSGRVGSRRRSAMRDSIARANRRDQGPSDSPVSSTHEDVAAGDDDYLSRLAANRQSGEMTAEGQSGDGRPSSDDEPMQEGDVRWGAVGAKPRVIRFHRHDRDTMRSREGLLNMQSDVEFGGDDPVSPVEDNKTDDP
ncbi:hypothetical protein HRG_001920 [Hirsutella rhossiliensis]|uniref:Uncharacterized protein n=1 Tax=Hirsutella rhossiliensis TaxID=111463 RepID=A0A9P8SL25_9HYPO|nr:uncharacterized protein HRG_01920 [Hirsutella rhossiliensis]KAH0966511.1 hypothetical protein HRG_01920 [Hirsutella rhossiliensis]